MVIGEDVYQQLLHATAGLRGETFALGPDNDSKNFWSRSSDITYYPQHMERSFWILRLSDGTVHYDIGSPMVVRATWQEGHVESRLVRPVGASSLSTQVNSVPGQWIGTTIQDGHALSEIAAQYGDVSAVALHRVVRDLHGNPVDFDRLDASAIVPNPNVGRSSWRSPVRPSALKWRPIAPGAAPAPRVVCDYVAEKTRPTAPQ